MGTMEATEDTGQIITAAMVGTILETMEEMVGTIPETMEEMEGISQVQTEGTVVISQEIMVETVDIGQDLHFHSLENRHELIQLPSPKLCDKLCRMSNNIRYIQK